MAAEAGGPPADGWRARLKELSTSIRSIYIQLFIIIEVLKFDLQTSGTLKLGL